jgi:outer membrane protein assembly factor BamB
MRTVYALDSATGKTEWQRELSAAPFGCATVARDAVIVPTYDGRVAAFAADDGRELWHTQLGIDHPVAEVVAFGLGG